MTVQDTAGFVVSDTTCIMYFRDTIKCLERKHDFHKHDNMYDTQSSKHQRVSEFSFTSHSAIYT